MLADWPPCVDDGDGRSASAKPVGVLIKTPDDVPVQFRFRIGTRSGAYPTFSFVNYTSSAFITLWFLLTGGARGSIAVLILSTATVE